jgi:membrane-bound lytic murein transglycosylase B
MTAAEDIVGPCPAAGTARVAVAVVAIVVLLLGGGVFAAVAFGVTPDAPVQLAAGLPPAPATDAPAVRSTGVSRSASRTGADPAWVARTAGVAGLPVPAMRAYADAELLLDAQQPTCHLRWNTLAGIGWIESRHGTVGGRTLGGDGRPSSPILGPALDGTDGNAAIRTTPGSASWHDDHVWEHAVGPLQFLSSTWNRWGADGDGDGVADPRDLDDAALAAGRYLCADGHDLATDAGWNAAVHSYNHDLDYVLAVAAAANTYAARTR